MNGGLFNRGDDVPLFVPVVSMLVLKHGNNNKNLVSLASQNVVNVNGKIQI